MSEADPGLGCRRHRRYACRSLCPCRRMTSFSSTAAADHIEVDQSPAVLRIQGPIFEDNVTVAGLPAQSGRGPSFARVFLCVKAHHTEAAARALAQHLAGDRLCRVGAERPQRERVIAEIVGRERARSAASSTSAPIISRTRRRSLFSGRGAVVVGELDGRRSSDSHRRAIHRPHAATLRAENAVLTDNVWGYPVGQAGLWRAAVRHGPDRRQHRRRARRRPIPPGADPAGA